LEIDMIYFNYSPSSNEQQNQIIASNYADIGVDLTARAVDYTQFNSAWIPADFEDAADGWAPQGQQADNWWFDHLHSESPANRWHISDSQLDEWAAAQSIAIDPAERAEIWKQIWDRMLNQAYRVVKPVGHGLEAYQPYTRGFRFAGALGASSSYYDWGEQVANIWLDK
jgi:ABC-type transport system substrate-binding protein